MNKFCMNKKDKDKILENVAFTKREREIFEKLVEGLKIAEIEKYMDCSFRTIQNDIKKIKEKINAFKKDEEPILFYVYIHIFPNNKKYVGITEHIPRRWGSCGLPYSENLEMYKDIIKYGWNNIRHEILTETTNYYKARKLESKLIEIFDLTNDKNGYNKKI